MSAGAHSAPPRGPGDRSRVDADAEAVRRVREGHRDAGRELFDRYWRPVLGFVRRLIGEAEAAEDLTQQTFVEAFGALDRFDPTRRFSSWLFAIALNNVRDWRKSHKRGETALEHEDVAPADAAFAGRLPDPETACTAHEDEALVSHALLGLPTPYREVLVLKDLAELPFEDIHVLLGLPVSTLKIRAVRAREMMRLSLDDDPAPGEE